MIILEKSRHTINFILFVPLKIKIHKFYFLVVIATIIIFKNYAQEKYQILLNNHLLNVSTLYEYNFKNDTYQNATENTNGELFQIRNTSPSNLIHAGIYIFVRTDIRITFCDGYSRSRLCFLNTYIHITFYDANSRPRLCFQNT